MPMNITTVDMPMNITTVDMPMNITTVDMPVDIAVDATVVAVVAVTVAAAPITKYRRSRGRQFSSFTAPNFFAV